MKIQIYTMQTPDEALAAIDAGVDHIGITPRSITPSLQGLPGEVDFATARAIRDAVGDKALRIALTVDTELDPIVQMVRAVEPDVLHLCPLAGMFPPQKVAQLSEMIPHTLIMQAISVADSSAIDEAVAYDPFVNFLILDTQAPDIAGIGASGKTHDWNISREIVQRVSAPVILAGGLSPQNVAEAVRAVRPYGVDSLTYTNQPLKGGGFRKDIDKIRAFAANARAAAQESHP